MGDVSRAAVIVSSDRAHQGTYEDKSGPAAGAWLETHGFKVHSMTVVPDEPDDLRTAIVRLTERESTEASTLDLIVCSGGTGLGPRDRTPDTLDRLCDYAVPGIGELLRRESLKYSLNAYLSRCGGWVKGRTLVLALPGNPKAVTEQLDILADLLPHALKSVRGECAHRRKTADHETHP